ncbi:MAG: endonuclease MutS2 [Clostridia bacterium]|nr:endonuclease MutS2 [Clostridia bacterium]
MKKNFFYFKSACALEFNKVMQRVAQYAICPANRIRIAELLPEYDAPCVQTLLMHTEAARTLLTYKPNIPLVSVEETLLESLERTAKQISLTAEEIQDIGRMLGSCRDLLHYYEDKKFATPSLDFFFEQLYTDTQLEQRISRTFLPSGAIADDASPELASIRRAIIRAGHAIKEELERYINSPAIAPHLQEPIVTIRSDRYVIPVKADNRGDITGLLHDTSGTGNTLFIEPIFVIEQNNKIKKLELEEQNEILRILAALSEKIALAAEQLKTSYRVMLSLDYIFAKAKYANHEDCCTPVIGKDKVISLKNARHPLIDKSVMIPLNVRMDKETDAIIVTGPNTGGKTVFLKTLGLLSLMVKAGLPVPAQSAEIFVFKTVYADIGDEQSIEQSLSTFSSHMRNIKNILSECGKRDLVLFDELGSGTDPVEGAALAVSVVKKIRAKHSFLAATTHYGELKTYALTTPGVKNASFAFDLVNLRPTYELQVGVPGKSYAFEISKRLGLSDDVIEDAKSYISGDQQSIDQVIDALNEQRNAYLERQKKLKSREKELTEEKAKLEKERKKLFQGADNKIAVAEQKAHSIIESARRQADLLQNELKELREKMDKASYHELKSSVKRATGRLQDVEIRQKKAETVSGKPLEGMPKVGQTVFLPTLNRNVTVESIGGNFVFISADSLRMKVKQSDLCVAKEEKQAPVSFRRAEFNRTVKTELDIRGMNVLDATEEIDRFLDQAVLSKMPSVTVIHGKGTGILRAGVHAHLKTHPSVRTFKLGAFGQGDSGVTIVDLK